MECSVLDVWDSMGDTREGRLSSVWLAKLIGEAFLRCLEFSACMSNVVSGDGTKQLQFLRMLRPFEHLKSLLIRTLFDWSRIWGLHTAFPTFY